MRVRVLVFVVVTVIGLASFACGKENTGSVTSASPLPTASLAPTAAAAEHSPTAKPASIAAKPSATPQLSPRRAPTTFNLKSSDNGKHLALVPGDLVVLTIEEADDGGYTWDYATKPDPIVLKQTYSEAAPQSTKCCGGMSTRTIKWIAERAGSTSVKLRETQAGSTPSPKDETFAFSVTVSA